MAKNIVIFSDGTGKEGGKGFNTNIYKIFNMIEDRTSHQIAFYDPGLGTGMQKIIGRITGLGISRNIQQCYRFIFDNFESKDRIFLFGFSRGAATMRSLSSFIHHFGVLPKSRPELIKKAYKIYKKLDFYKKKDNKKREKKAQEFIAKHHTMWTKIRFIGCFDTVAALGLPFKIASILLNSIPFFRHRFHDYTLSKSIENAYHALAIDDERKTFHPVLWEKEVEEYQKAHQVWFSGMHTDVGGGYKEQTLSDIPLVWMIEKAVKHGLLIYPKHKVKINENANGIMHNSRGTCLTKLYRRKIRSWKPEREDSPIVHQSVLERKKNTKNKNNPPYHPWIFDIKYKVETWSQYKTQKWYIK